MPESVEIILARIDERVDLLVKSHEEIKPIIDDVKKIKSHLYNDDLTGSDGIIKKVELHSHLINQIIVDKNLDKKVAAIWASVVAFVVSFLWKVASWLWF